MNPIIGPSQSVTLPVWSLSIGILCWVDDTPKPPAKTSEEPILDRIARLQSQLGELRAAMALVRAAAPTIPAVAAAPAVPNAAAPPTTAPSPGPLPPVSLAPVEWTARRHTQSEQSAPWLAEVRLSAGSTHFF
jgi:hypothetical protein